MQPLHWMCIRGNIRCLQFFKEINPDTIKDSLDNSLLHAAAQYGHYKCCHFLINVLKSDVNAVNKHKETALHKAAAGNYHEVIHLLLSKGADLNSIDVKGRSPLHKASMNSATHSLTQLLERGAKVK
jgi:ankyrin repeat protein